MFETLKPAPADPILGLTEAFKADPNPHKINLGVGVYQDAQGRTPVLKCVKEAERRLLDSEQTKDYLGIAGSPDYAACVQELLFGAEHEIVQSARAFTAQTPGGTAALRVAGDFLRQVLGKSRIWVSDPTWPNHAGVFKAAGLEVATYPYFAAAANAVDVPAMLAALRNIPEGEVVLLHACCHNPTGADPAVETWQRIAEVVQARRLLPLVDFAYQGFGDGLREDARGLHMLAQQAKELLVCSSFSKNFGLYNERVGALTAVAADRTAAGLAAGHVKTCIRANYSNPPSHGGAVVVTILRDPQLRSLWDQELRTMRDRINTMRSQFVERLKARGAPGDWSFLSRQRGMFSFSGLAPQQVDRLREKYSIYIVRSGRINVAGMTPDNLDRLCTAIAEVLQS